MHLERTRLLQHPHDLTCRCSANNRVIDNNETLALNGFTQWIELAAYRVDSRLVRGSDEGTSDVAVFYESLTKGDTARCSKSLSGGDPRVWNAEHNIQIRDYGAQRAYGCELLETRYDLIVAALGGHGELVERREDLAPAIERALASGRPACVNVMIESHAAPTVRAAELATG